MTTQTPTMGTATQAMAGMDMSDAPPSTEGGGDMLMTGTDASEMLTGGMGADTLEGGYGDDHLVGGDGDDRLDGGRGSDLLIGGAGNDVLVSRSDAGEDRIGQIVTDQLSRQIDDEVDTEYLKLAEWVDLALVGDDVLVGGEGADKFVFEALINAKKEIIEKHTNDEGVINWAGVTGENDELHDHWVDSIGIDVIADYEAGVDSISIKGHTTNIEVSHRAIDTDGDGMMDDVVSDILLYSQQGANGGAHDEDLIGHIVVHGDLVDADDIETDAGVTYGIVDTIDELEEAIHPKGETKWTELADGSMHLGYDTRDVDGDPIGSDAEAFSSNTWLDTVEMAKSVGDYDAPGVALSHEGGSGRATLMHDPAMATTEGTLAFSFTARAADGQTQVLFDKADGDDALTASIDADGKVTVTLSSDGEARTLTSAEAIEAGVETHVVFAFGTDATTLFVDGAEADQDDGLAEGLSGNIGSVQIGSAADGNDAFSGEIGNLLLLDRPVDGTEALLLASSGGDLEMMADVWGGDEPAPEDDAEPEAEPDGDPVADPAAEPEMATAEEKQGFFGRIMEFIKSLFGMEDDEDEAPVAETPMPDADPDAGMDLLSEVVPDYDADDLMPEDADEDEDAEMDMLAAA